MSYLKQTTDSQYLILRKSLRYLLPSTQDWVNTLFFMLYFAWISSNVHTCVTVFVLILFFSSFSFFFFSTPCVYFRRNNYVWCVVVVWRWFHPHCSNLFLSIDLNRTAHGCTHSTNMALDDGVCRVTVFSYICSVCGCAKKGIWWVFLFLFLFLFFGL